MKNLLDHIVDYGSGRSTRPFGGAAGGRQDSQERSDGFLSTTQLRQLRTELQQRRLSNEGALRRKLARLFRWLG